MVSRAYRTCLELVEKMVKHGFVNQINNEDLGILITRYIGADERTIVKYARVCVDAELLTPHPVNKHVYYINLAKADHEIREVFGRHLRQLELLEPKS